MIVVGKLKTPAAATFFVINAIQNLRSFFDLCDDTGLVPFISIQFLFIANKFNTLLQLIMIDCIVLLISTSNECTI